MKIENNTITYHKGFKKVDLSIDSIVWAYIQLEDVKASMCCGSYNSVISRLIVLDTEGNKHSFQYEGKEKAGELLEKLTAINPNFAVGYTTENREKFEVSK